MPVTDNLLAPNCLDFNYFAMIDEFLMFFGGCQSQQCSGATTSSCWDNVMLGFEPGPLT